jgi:hypothetical protein
VPLIQDRTYGIFAHKTLPASKLVVIWTGFILLIGTGLLIYRFRKLDKSIKLLFYIAGFYTLVLLAENMKNYYASGRFSFAVHGRYLFCVLPIIYLIWNNLIIENLKRPAIKLAYVLLAITIFLVSSFPIFIQKSSPEWYKNNSIIK